MARVKVQLNVATRAPPPEGPELPPTKTEVTLQVLSAIKPKQIQDSGGKLPVGSVNP